MPPLSRHYIPGLLLLLACAFPVTLRAAPPREELLRRVPGDVGFCFVVEDLRDHSQALLASPFVRAFRSSPFGKYLLESPEARKLTALNQELIKHLGVGWARLRDDIFGDAVVFAYRPGPRDKLEQEQGLFMLWARDATLLAQLVDRLNRAQQQSGDLQELASREYGGTTYRVRVERRQSNYYYLRGPLLVFTNREEMLHRVIDLQRQAADPAEAALVRELRRLDETRPFATWWLNPRAFEPELQQKLDAAQGPAATALRTLLVYWKALEGISLSLRLEDDFQLALAVRGRTDALPDAARQAIAEASRPSDLWQRLPDDALLAVAARIDFKALVTVFGEFLSEDSRKAIRLAADRGVGAVLGKDVVNDLLPFLGPDIGLCIAVPSTADGNGFPLATLALRVQSGGIGMPADLTLLGALNSCAMLAVLSRNREHPDQMSLRAVVQDKVEVKYLAGEGVFPLGLRPAFALKDGYLVVGSSPDAVRQLKDAAKASAASDDGVRLLRLSLKGLAEFVQAHAPGLSLHIAQKDSLPTEEARRRLHALLDVLRLFDSFDVRQQAAPGGFTLSARLRTAQPLK